MVKSSTPRPGRLTPLPGEGTQNSVWTLWKGQKSVASTGIQTLHFPACIPVAIPTGLSRLLTKNVEESSLFRDVTQRRLDGSYRF